MRQRVIGEGRAPSPSSDGGHEPSTTPDLTLDRPPMDDLGFLPHRRSAPMAASRPNPSNAWPSAPLFHGHDDVFGGPPRPTHATPPPPPPPPYDQPVYDDDDFDIFDGVAAAFSANDDGAASSSPAPAPTNQPYEDLLGSFAAEAPAVQVDDLLPGFGGTTVESKSSDAEENNDVAHPSTAQSKSAFSEDPFVFLESVSSSTYRSSESSDDMNNPSTSDDRKAGNSSPNGEIFDEVDGFDGFVNIKLKSPSGGESVDSSYASRESTKPSSRYKESGSILFDVPTSMSHSHVSADGSRSPNMGSDFTETNANIGLSSRSDENNENLDEIWLSVSEVPLFTQPTISPPPTRPPPKPLASITDVNGKKKSHDSVKNPPSPAIDELEEFATGRHPQPPGDGWSNIPFSDGKEKFHDSVKNPPSSAIDELEEFDIGRHPRHPGDGWSNIPFGDGKEKFQDSVKNPPSSAIDELEEFDIGRHPRPPGDGWSNIPFSEEDSEANFTAAASAAAMKEAMDKAETKLKHAKEVRESEEDAKAAKYRDSTQMNGDDKTSHDVSERENRDRQELLEREQREKEEKEKERKRIEKEKEEREKIRRAVEMVTREARERAAIEARLRAERAAVEKATNMARLRAERAAVQKAAAEARERAAAEARERAAAKARERAAAEAREKALAEARDRAAAEARERQTRERAAVERAAAEVRLRAQAEARERAAAAARERQQKNESFFGMSARPNSAPRHRSTSDHFGSQFQTESTDAARASVGTASNMRKASSTANIIDDLTSVFGAVASSMEFQEIDGESEERRKARYERDMRTRERAAKALAEKNERDIQTQMEQEERHRIAETLDIEIKRWAFGKEGNLRALLSTLHCVLWPECGWQPVSLVDLITAASVKKVYRKATLCIHPDKVQQKGATLQQKYIAEKVFDLLKEAWNKFNSEELF